MLDFRIAVEVTTSPTKRKWRNARDAYFCKWDITGEPFCYPAWTYEATIILSFPSKTRYPVLVYFIGSEIVISISVLFEEFSCPFYFKGYSRSISTSILSFRFVILKYNSRLRFSSMTGASKLRRRRGGGVIYAKMFIPDEMTEIEIDQRVARGIQSKGARTSRSGFRRSVCRADATI